MRFSSLWQQIAKLKDQLPKEILIRLRDGTEYRHPGPTIDFVVQGLNEAWLGKGPILHACLNTDQTSTSPDFRSQDHLIEIIRAAALE
jgi:hypothetical protein